MALDTPPTEAVPTTRNQEPTTIVVPCYNEIERLDEAAILDLADRRGLRLLFVDDGSTDGTPAFLDWLASYSPAIDVLHLERNCGKAEAVRRGMLAAIESGATVTGFYDADFATPPTDLLQMIAAVSQQPQLALAVASRYDAQSVAERKLGRRALGKVFRTLANTALGFGISDTQCGAKVARVNPALAECLLQPFRGRWSFDVELIDRLMCSAADSRGSVPRIGVLPSPDWAEVSGSKLHTGEMMAAAWQVLCIGAARRWRRRPSSVLSLTPTAALVIDLSDRRPSPRSFDLNSAV